MEKLERVVVLLYKIKMKFLCFFDRTIQWDGGAWQSWDLHPWGHPWLTKKNLKEIKEFSGYFIKKEKEVASRRDSAGVKIGFVGNIANCMYMRAIPLRAGGWSVDMFIHPQDAYVMSNPGWEYFKGTLPAGVSTLEQCSEVGIQLPVVDGVYQYSENPDWQCRLVEEDYEFVRETDKVDFPSFMSNLPTLSALQEMDVLWGTQNVYLSYLANRPYVVSQSGGDIWLEASRQDELGRVQRKAFSNARVFLVSNPWSFAHARRFGFKHLVYLPLILDQEMYAPGDGKSRKAWKDISGGDFFVLTSSRLDERNKGSRIGIEGFASFAKSYPSARLVVIGWGNDIEKYQNLFIELGIADKVIELPVSGKALIRDYLRSADVFIDQFVLGYYGSAGLEAMACGLPVIGRIEKEQYDALCETGSPPILNSCTSDEVTAALLKLALNPEYRLELAQAHREWFIENHGSEKWLPAYNAVLSSTAKNCPANFEKSPLSRPLSYTEKLYHAKGMLCAPPHPHYGW